MKFEKIKDDHAEAHQTVVSNIVARDDVDDNQWAQFNLYILKIYNHWLTIIKGS